MFGGKSMYQDKERERLAKVRREEEQDAKLRDDWTKDKMARRHRMEEELSFEDWKQEKEKQEKEKAEEEKKANMDKPKPKASSPTKLTQNKRPTTTKSSNDSDSEGDDAETADLVKGYKTTSDGRKTSYFNNELDSTAKELIGDIAPKPISAGESVGTDFAPKPIQAAAPEQGSSWNYAGTFEEKDMSSWANSKLTEILGGVTHGVKATGAGDSILNGAIHIKVTKVKTLTGDAEIIVSRGKRRHLYDFTAELEWEATLTAFGLAEGVGDKQDKKVRGSMSINDISPGEDEAEFQVSIKKSCPPEHRERVNKATGTGGGLVGAIKESFAAFQTEYQKL